MKDITVLNLLRDVLHPPDESYLRTEMAVRCPSWARWKPSQNEFCFEMSFMKTMKAISEQNWAMRCPSWRRWKPSQNGICYEMSFMKAMKAISERNLLWDVLHETDESHLRTEFAMRCPSWRRWKPSQIKIGLWDVLHETDESRLRTDLALRCPSWTGWKPSQNGICFEMSFIPPFPQRKIHHIHTFQ